MTAASFQVIVAGGGIAGLTLANALEKAGINFTLLEARDDIAPKVGASIGIFQNGARILDQLGCLDAIERETVPLTRARSRYSDGKQFATNNGIKLVETRFNLPALFIDRQDALRIMYENLKDKSQIKLQKRISKVDHSEQGVTVTCHDGTAINGDVLIGCDGVHSVVRNEMWRLAHLHEQESFDPSDKNLLFAEYQCLFGISSQTNGIVDGEVTVNHDHGFSTMVIGGVQKYVQVTSNFQALQDVKGYITAPTVLRYVISLWVDLLINHFTDKSNELPRYTTKDAETFADDIEKFHITPEVTFSDLWKNKNTYTLVPTEEAQLKRWCWGRIACVGDCVHKMTPNMGAGGNAAMETAVALANELKKLVDTAEKGKPSYDTIKTHLGNYQKLRDTRLTAVLKAANGLTRIHALATLKDKIFAYWILPAAGDLTADLQSDMITGAVKIDYLPTPERSLRGTMPFNPSQGLGQTESKWKRAVYGLPFLAVAAAAFYFMWGICLPPVLDRIDEILDKGVYNQIGEAVHVKTLQNFYGIELLDSRFRGLVACFASFQFVDLACSWQGLTFLSDFGLFYSILLIESARRANIMTLSFAPLILGYNSQFFGVGTLIGLWCFVHYIQTPIENFRARDMRLTDISYSASVLPVILLAHYLPHFISFSTWIDPATRSAAQWVWQLFPLWATILQYALKKTIMPDTVQEDRIKNTERDLPVIKYTIYSLCAISAATWCYTLSHAPFSPQALFVPDITAARTGDDFIRLFMQFDGIFFTTSGLLWLLYLFGDLKRAGMLDASWASILGRGLAVLAAAGPGVTVGLGWWWREQLLATKWHKDALVPKDSK